MENNENGSDPAAPEAETAPETETSADAQVVSAPGESPGADMTLGDRSQAAAASIADGRADDKAVFEPAPNPKPEPPAPPAVEEPAPQPEETPEHDFKAGDDVFYKEDDDAKPLPAKVTDVDEETKAIALCVYRKFSIDSLCNVSPDLISHYAD